MANGLARRARGESFVTDIPSRLDRLPWSRWHWRVVIALGITWMLDGLEVTLVGSLGPILRDRAALGLTEAEVGATASAYLAGAVIGALFFGRCTDRFGRKRLFLVTLAVYLVATLASACAWSFASFAFFRAVTGAGIGGEYAAINSAIDELLPARVRGRADLAINSTYWLGTALGSIASLVLLDPRVLPEAVGWRACFAVGAVLGTSVLFLRRHLPESPRWLLLHGRVDEAEAVTSEIERAVARDHGSIQGVAHASRLVVQGSVTFTDIATVLLRRHRRRTILGIALMIAQAFVYNGIFFTYALVLSRYYAVPAGSVGLYLLPFAAGNLIGPLVFGPLFDTIGRRVMIAVTYALGGILLAATAFAFERDWLTARSMTVAWCAVFFVISAAASAAYLTVSELFPVQLRGMAIALFYAVGTGAGGLVAPAVFGALLATGSRESLCLGYGIGAALMIGTAAVAAFLGVAAERKSLEEIESLAG